MPDVPEVRVKSWADLNNQLFKNSWNDHLQRHRSNYAFRGVGTTGVGYDLSTSLSRLGIREGYHYANLEGSILRRFKKYAYTDLASTYNEWYWLTLAQHHGLPT